MSRAIRAPERRKIAASKGGAIPGARARSIVLAGCMAATLLAAVVGAAGADEARPAVACKRRHASRAAFLRSAGSFDVYNGLFWAGAGAAIHFGTDPSRRWTHENGFDAGIRSGLRLDRFGARRDADAASDVFLALSVGGLPLAAMGSELARTGDCIEVWDMVGQAFEATTLALFVTESIKVAAGRERPFGRRCGVDAPRDARCGGDDRNLSFVSGHATLAAAGAGVTCRFALEREAFGSSRAARVAPCVLGAASAFLAGTLRVASDRHWGSDVLVGFGVGALVGSLDVWGPFDWLRFEKRDGGGRIEATGLVLPFAQGGAVGARLAVVY
ncbi:MAG: phosphatase PAP2 family protein [Myxococcota bacterium]